MGPYTFRVSGDFIDEARATLERADGVHVGSTTDDRTIVVTADAPTQPGAEALVRSALPENGSYSIARPEPLEDDEDE